MNSPNAFADFAPQRPTLTPGPLAPRTIVVGPADPYKGPKEAAGLTGQTLDNRITTATLDAKVREAQANATIAEDKIGDTKIDNMMKLRNAFEAQAGVKDYRSSIPQVTAGLKTANNPAGDNALIYAYAKVMDPGSAVRESEAAGVANSDTVFGRAYAYAQKQLDGTGTFSPEARAGLRREMINKTVQLNRAYETERERYATDAREINIEPERVIGKHSGAKFLPEIQAYAKGQRKPDPAMSSAIDGAVRTGRSYDEANALARQTNPGAPPIDRATYEAAMAHYKANPTYSKSYASATTTAAPGYDASLLAQGMSGVNEGLASVAGAPVDLMTGAINLGSSGINALANTDIPMIESPTLGSDWIKDRMDGWAVTDDTSDPTKQFVRRVGESVGAASIPAGFAGSIRSAAGQIIAGAGGGGGAAAAQQVFPGNPIAELAGEVVGGGASGLSVLAAGRRGAQNQIHKAVPTSDALRDQAGQLYRQAESRGIVADPQDTATLANDLRRTLTDEGLISPSGRINEVYPKARQAVLLADDYAGGQMNPTQIQTVRKMAADGLSSDDMTERRLGGIITRVVDDWAAPMAPELSEARGVAKRYLEAGELETAKELAGARAGQFSGSGYENALRTDFRALDRAEVKGQKQFSEPVVDAIHAVSRGTALSNLARGIGRLAPNTPGAIGLGSVLPSMAAGAYGGLGVGALTGLTLAGAGAIGRGAATSMGLRAAEVAELTARNGGRLPQAPLVTPEIEQMIRALAAGEAVKYLSPDDQDGGVNQDGRAYTNPLAGGKHQQPGRPLPGALAFPFR